MMSAICFKIMLGRELFSVRRGKIKQDWQNVHVLKLANGYVKNSWVILFTLCIFEIFLE